MRILIQFKNFENVCNFLLLFDIGLVVITKFLGQACTLIETKNERIIVDPWIVGPCNVNSWYTLRSKAATVKNIPTDVDYIYISHEHPDHFSPNFFLNKEYQSILLKKKVKILFQETKDKRVLSFLQKILLQHFR